MQKYSYNAAISLFNTGTETYLSGKIGSSPQQCYSVYRQVRPLYALGTAIGLDEGAFGGATNTNGGNFIYNENKDLVAVGSGTPFYTNGSNPENPACLQNLGNGQNCVIIWNVNATGPVNNTWTFYAYATSSASQQANSAKVNISIMQ